MTIRFGEYKKRDIYLSLKFCCKSFPYYTGYRWWTVNANFFRNKPAFFSQKQKISMEKENCYVAF